MITISTWIVWVWLVMWITLTIISLLLTNKAYKAAAGKLYDSVSKMINQELDKRRENSEKKVEEKDA